MRYFTVGLALLLALPQAVLADDAQTTREVKLSKGKAKIKFYALPTEGSATSQQRTPTVGVAPMPYMGLSNYLAKQFDDTRKATVIPPSRFGDKSPFAAGFDSMIRSDLEREISSTCKSFKLNYLLLMSPPDTSFKTDATAFMFGLGRMRFRNSVEIRIYDCPTAKIIWNNRLLLESSQSMSGMTFEGTNIATGESERAFAGVIAEKISSDLSW